MSFRLSIRCSYWLATVWFYWRTFCALWLDFFTANSSSVGWGVNHVMRECSDKWAPCCTAVSTAGCVAPVIGNSRIYRVRRPRKIQIHNLRLRDARRANWCGRLRARYFPHYTEHACWCCVSGHRLIDATFYGRG